MMLHRTLTNHAMQCGSEDSINNKDQGRPRASLDGVSGVCCSCAFLLFILKGTVDRKSRNSLLILKSLKSLVLKVLEHRYFSLSFIEIGIILRNSFTLQLPDECHVKYALNFY